MRTHYWDLLHEALLTYIDARARSKKKPIFWFICCKRATVIFCQFHPKHLINFKIWYCIILYFLCFDVSKNIYYQLKNQNSRMFSLRYMWYAKVHVKKFRNLKNFFLLSRIYALGFLKKMDLLYYSNGLYFWSLGFIAFFKESRK